MPELLLTPVAIGYLADFLLLSLTVASLWGSSRDRRVSPVEKAFQRTFAGFAVFSLLCLGEEALRQPWSLYLHYCLNVVVAVSLFFTFRFVYLFPKAEPRWVWEARFVSWLALLMIGVEIWFLAHRFNALWVDRRVIWRPHWAEGTVGLEFGWMLVVMLRTSLFESAASGDRRFWLFRLLRPRGDTARTAQRLALLMSFLAIVATLSGLALRQDVLGLTVSLGTLAGAYLFVLIYLNSSTFSVSLRVKLVGSVLPTLLAVLTLINWTVVSLYLQERSEEQGGSFSRFRPLVASRQSLRFSPNGRGGYVLTRVAAHFDPTPGRRLSGDGETGTEVKLPFTLKFFDRGWDRAGINWDGFIVFGGEMPRRQDFAYRYGSRPVILVGLSEFAVPPEGGDAGVFYGETGDHATITWRRLRLAQHPEGENTFQVELHRDGVIELNYLDIQAGAQIRFARATTEAWLAGVLPGWTAGPPVERLFTDGSLTGPLDFGPEGMLQDNLLEWRRTLHPVSLRMCVITLLVTLVVVCLFPLVINSIVIQPLDRLVAGVGKVDAGDLGASVTASRPDEIGYLSESFNSMVTSIRTTTVELARHRDKLEGLVVQRTEALRREIQAKELIAEDLERAKAAAEAANQAKSVFLASMSHEIRTPMNGVTGMTSLLLETPLSGEQRHYSETIRNSTEALLTIVNDILDLSKIEAGRLDLDEVWFDLRAAFEESLDLLSPRAAEKRIEMICRVDDSLPARALGDVVRLRQVMLNLLGNALKFTESGSVCVTVGRAAPSESGPDAPPGHFRIECCVRDTGMGIAPEVMARLFQPFSQADSSTTRRFGGTGLGLVISRRLVEAMGGRMWAESPPEGGAAFHFTINLRTDEPEPPVWCRAGATLAGRRCLVVHDHVPSRELIAHYLRLWGATVDARGAVGEALEGEGPGKTAFWDTILFDEGAVERLGSGSPDDSLAAWAARGVSLICLAWPGSGAFPTIPLPPGTRLMRKPARPAQLWEEMAALGPGPVSVGNAAPPTVKAGSVTEASLRVLVADDNEVNLKVATAYLHLLGCQAWVARNGREVLEAVSQQPFDLILMDVQMPEMDGLEAARELGKRFSPADVPIIVAVSAGVSPTEREACFAAGMADFLAKPVRLAEMEAGLKRWREWLRLDPDVSEGETDADGEG